jgi:hypothetical protein
MAELRKAAQGTFDELRAGVEPALAAIARRLRAIIRAVDVSTVDTAHQDSLLAEANRAPVRDLVATALAQRRRGAAGPARASTSRQSR